MDKGYSVKAAAAGDYRIKSAMCVAVVTAVVIAGVYLAVYNCVAGSPLFAVAYTIAVILGADYVVMKVNTVFATYISAEDGYLYIKNWDNNFFPYSVNSRIRALREFIPAKTRIFEIPIDEITDIAVGTKNYITKLYPEDDLFKKRLARCEKNGGSGQKRFLKNSDMFYVRTVDKKSVSVGITRYDANAIVKIIKLVKRENSAAAVMLNSREFKILRMRGK